jgi:mRNA-degrading endonuclease RelE of RelBE toxin-antitoxin system
MKYSMQVVEALRNMHPGVRHDIRRQLAAAAAGRPCDLKPLQGGLDGLWRLRTGRHRVICFYEKGELVADYLATRNVIYDLYLSMRELPPTPAEATDD